MKNELTFERQHRTAPARHFSGGGIPSDRHPSDWNWTDTALAVAFAAVVLFAIGCMAAGITVWSPLS